jgi:hypothetical protein
MPGFCEHIQLDTWSLASCVANIAPFERSLLKGVWCFGGILTGARASIFFFLLLIDYRPIDHNLFNDK